MYESSAFAVRGKVAGRGIFKTLNNGLDDVRFLIMSCATTAGVAYRFSRSIVSDDQREGRMKLDCLAARVVEGANSREKSFRLAFAWFPSQEEDIPQNRQLVNLRCTEQIPSQKPFTFQ